MHFVMAMPTAAQSTLTLSGDPQAMVISSAVAGQQPGIATDEGTAYSLEADGRSSILAAVDAPLPAGVELRVQLEPPAGALGYGAVSLTTTPQVLVGEIPPGTYIDLGIRYEFSATLQAGVVPISTRQITYTVTTTP